jgi:hypothetical protein
MADIINIPTPPYISKLRNRNASAVWLGFGALAPPTIPTGSNYSFLLSTPSRNVYGINGSTLYDLSNLSASPLPSKILGQTPTVVGVAGPNALAIMTSTKAVYLVQITSNSPLAVTVTPQGTLPTQGAALIGDGTNLYAVDTTGTFRQYSGGTNGTWNTITVTGSGNVFTCSTLVGTNMYLGSASSLCEFTGSALTGVSGVGDGAFTALAGLSMPHNPNHGPDADSQYLYVSSGDQVYCVFLTDTTQQNSVVMGVGGTGVANLAIGQDGYLYCLNGTTLNGCNPLNLFRYYAPPGGGTEILVLPNMLTPINAPSIINTTQFSFYNAPDGNPVATWAVSYQPTPNGPDYTKTFSGTLQPDGTPVPIPIENTNNNTTCDSLVMEFDANADGGWTIVVIDIDPHQ